MQTEYDYGVKSNIEIPEATLNIFGCKIIFSVDRDKFLSNIKLTIKGSMSETEELAYRIIQFINDIFIINYGCCEIFCSSKKEISENKNDVKQTEMNVRCDIRTRRAIKNKKELEGQINESRFKKKAKMISALADGVRATSTIDRYINFFKVIECEFNPRNNHMNEDLRKTRLANLINALKVSSCPETPQNIINNLVDLRHGCSHLKEKTSFGFSNSELKNIRRIKQNVLLVEKIARELVKS